MKRAENMKDTWREYVRWDKLSLALMYNVIKYMFDFNVEEFGTAEK